MEVFGVNVWVREPILKLFNTRGVGGYNISLND